MLNKKMLVVVDMQNDFVDGALGSEQAQEIVDKVCKKIEEWEGDIMYTLDTHTPDDYMQTTEGEDLPVPHCLIGSDGHKLNSKVRDALAKKAGSESNMLYNELSKHTFGSPRLASCVSLCSSDVEIVGLCTDTGVISNAIMIRNWHETMRVTVDASCCAGVTPQRHRIALEAMKCCGIKVINDEH